MRVISGSLRGLRLAPPSGDRVRPTLDRVKEAAFNIIQFSVPGGRFLDMFAGSGQMGIEALSRGAASAWFFEPDAAAFRLLRGNVGRLPGGLDARLYQAPYARLAQLAPKPVFDVAYIDPPFGGGLFLEALADGAVTCGLPRDKARRYAAQMVLGTAQLALQSDQHTAAMKDAVCSPGGTTIAGVRALERGGFRSAAMEAVIAAYEKTLALKS